MLAPRSFTLLELLLVVFLLAAVAGMASSLGTQVDQQSRYDDTKVRRERIRVAILGEEERRVGQQVAIGGFAADMGRLPESLSELIEAPSSANLQWKVHLAEDQLPEVASSERPPRGAAVGAGWRGPYLRGQTETGPGGVEVLAYRDGWQNVDEDEDGNYGWRYEAEDEALDLSSAGAPSGLYAFEQPRTRRELVGRRDYLVSLADLSVRVRNQSGAPADLTQVAVLVVAAKAPRPSEAGTSLIWDRRVSGPFLGELADGDLSESLGPLVPADEARPLEVPWGRRALALVRAGSDADEPDLLGPLTTLTFLPGVSSSEVTLVLDEPTTP